MLHVIAHFWISQDEIDNDTSETYVWYLRPFLLIVFGFLQKYQFICNVALVIFRHFNWELTSRPAWGCLLKALTLKLVHEIAKNISLISFI